MKTRLAVAACALAAASYVSVTVAAELGTPPTSATAARPLHVLSDAELDTVTGGQILEILGVALAAIAVIKALDAIGNALGNALASPPPPPPPPRNPRIIIIVRSPTR